MLQARVFKLAGIAGVTHQARHIRAETAELEVVDAHVGDVQHDESPIQRVERPPEQLARTAVPSDQQERLTQARHLPPEVLQRQRLPERAVLYQCEQRPDRVRPADDREVDGDRHPEPLPVGECVRDLAETDRRRGEAHEVERVEEPHAVRLPFPIHARDHREPDNADREDDDEDDQRCPHAPHHQEDGRRFGRGRDIRRSAAARAGVAAEDVQPVGEQGIGHRASRYRRWYDTVSTTSKMTETTLATRAPPDRETTLAVASAVRPSEVMYTAYPHTSAAAMS